MQDGAAISGEDASAWLREHFAGDPKPEVRMDWAVNDEHDEAHVQPPATHPLFASG
jgi:hypothetical protein